MTVKRPPYSKPNIPWGHDANPSMVAFAVNRFETALGFPILVKVKEPNLNGPINDFSYRAQKYIFYSEDDFNNLIKKIKIVLFFFNQAIQSKPEAAVDCYDQVQKMLSQDNDQLYFSHESYQSIKNDDYLDNKVKVALEHYHTLCEIPFKYLLTLLSFSKSVIYSTNGFYGLSAYEQVKNVDPSKKAQFLEEKTSIIAMPCDPVILLEGFDRHIRNASAHKHIEITDSDKEKFILKDPRSNWFKEFDYEGLKKEIKSLDDTISALTMALLLCPINHVEKFVKFSKLRFEKPTQNYIKAKLFQTFSYYGFEIMDLKKEEDFSSISLSVKAKLLATNSQSLGSYASINGKEYFLPPINSSINIEENIIGIFQRCHDIFNWYKVIEIEVSDEKGSTLHKLKIWDPGNFYNDINVSKTHKDLENIFVKYKI